MKQKLILLTLVLFMVAPGQGLAIEHKNFNKTINGTTLYISQHIYDETLPYIVFLHGGPGENCAFPRAVCEKLQWKVNVVFIDQRGCGKSNRDVPVSTYDFDTLITDLDEVLDCLNLDRVILMGHSWGGVYGLLYALAHPEKIIALLGVDMVFSWNTALEQYYCYARHFASENLSLLKKLLAENTLDDEEILRLKKFCYFMHQYYRGTGKTGKKIHIETVISRGLCRSRNELEAIISELETDVAELESCYASGRKWDGWVARGITRKYGCYAKPYMDGDRGYSIKLYKDVKSLYSDDERSYNNAMIDGLNANHPGRSRTDYFETLKKLDAPFFYLYGSQDVIFKDERVKHYIHKKYGEDHVLELKRASHNPIVQDPYRFKIALERIYKKLSPKR